MKICIFGSSGVIGNGIKKKLKNHKLFCYNSKIYDFKKKEYKKKFIKHNIDAFIHAAGVTDEEVEKNESFALKRAGINIIGLLDQLKKKNCKYFIYISSIRVYDEKSEIIDKVKLPDEI